MFVHSLKYTKAVFRMRVSQHSLSSTVSCDIMLCSLVGIYHFTYVSKDRAASIFYLETSLTIYHICMCVCVCVYIYIYTHIHIYIYTYTHTHTNTHTHTYIHTYIHTCMYICMLWIQMSNKMTVEYGICHKYKIIQSMHSILYYGSPLHITKLIYRVK